MRIIYTFILLIVILLITTAAGFVFFGQTSISTDKNNKLKVVTTLYPLYDFAKNLGQDKVNVTLLLPPGVESHAFEPKPNDIFTINQTDIFIYTGKFMETWVEDLLKGVTNENLIIVDASQGVELMPASLVDNDEPAGSPDPHIWLDFFNAQTIVDNISEGLSKKDPALEDFYLQNAMAYKIRLEELDQRYQRTLGYCRTREIVYGGHYAFGYLAKRYGLNYVAAQGLSPNSEPTANDLTRLAKQIKDNNLKYIFYEELTSPKIAQILAQETDAKMLLLNAGHNITKKDLEAGKSFLSIMEENLTNLKIGLECN